MSTAGFGISGLLSLKMADGAPKYIHDSLKRLVDIALCSVGLLIAAPLIAVLGLLIKLSSKGPVFYVQERLGKGGKPFSIFKLRTMSIDAEAGGPKWATQGDPRVTPLGRFLRKCHLDELPQLVNVISGDMSLIGPRPERPCFVQKLQGSIPLYTARLVAKPGITGLAQVKHHYDRSIEDVETKLKYDLEYIHNACLLMDLQILALTVVKVVSGRSGS